MKERYWKITNADECHYGYKYKTGKNILPGEFKAYGDCINGGFYFAGKDILAFLSHGVYIRGVYIREVFLYKDSRVYLNPGTPQKFKTDKFKLGKRRKLTAKVIQELISSGANIYSKAGAYALSWSAENGYKEIVELLIKSGVDVSGVAGAYALSRSAGIGHKEIVELLIKSGVDVSGEAGAYALRLSAKNFYIEIVEMLENAKKEVEKDEGH